MGEFSHTVDTKGRLIIPAKFREQLGTQFIVTRGMDGCLFGYSLDEWQVLEAKLKELPLTKKKMHVHLFASFIQQQRSVSSISREGLICRLHYEPMPHSIKSVLWLVFLIELKFGAKIAGIVLPMKQKTILMKLLKKNGFRIITI